LLFLRWKRRKNTRGFREETKLVLKGRINPVIFKKKNNFSYLLDGFYAFGW